MPRIRALSPDESPENREIWERFASYYGGNPPNSMLTMARVPGLVAAFSELTSVCIRRAGTVPSDLKWLVAHMASRGAGCRYCAAHTLHNGSKNGVSPEKLEAIWIYETSPLFSEAERAALSLALASGQNMVSDADFEALRPHFDDRQLAEIVGVIALFGFLNRWNDTVGTTLEPAALEFADEQQLVSKGWDVGPHAEAAE
jgi:alkylhydroperoxidase family enzyme